MKLRSFAISLLLLLLLTGTARAACLQQDVFCSDKYVFTRKLLLRMDCKDLWRLRNSILNEHGYCFSRKLEAAEFDNADCTVDVLEKLDLNRFERDNVTLIFDVERTMLCH